MLVIVMKIQIGTIKVGANGLRLRLAGNAQLSDMQRRKTSNNAMAEHLIVSSTFHPCHSVGGLLQLRIYGFSLDTGEKQAVADLGGFGGSKNIP